MDDLINDLSWVGKCVKKIDVTNVGQQHDLIDLLKFVDIMFDAVELLDEERD